MKLQSKEICYKFKANKNKGCIYFTGDSKDKTQLSKCKKYCMIRRGDNEKY